MIKIENIEPLNEKITKNISEIEDEFFKRVQIDYNPLNSLKISKTRGKLVKKIGNRIDILLDRNFSSEEARFIDFISNKENYKNIIIGKPQQLQIVINSSNVLDIFGEEVAGKFKSNEFSKGIEQIFGYEKYFRSKAKKGNWYAKQLNIKSCPYCNSQYTITITRERSEVAKRFQFDHFFAKSRYPFLSISMYNLVPSCASCNLNKSSIDANIKDYYNPYYKSLAGKAKFKLKYKPDIKKLSIGDVADLKIEVEFINKYREHKKYVETHNKLFDIAEIYQRHTDVIEDILYKAIVNNISFKTDIYKIKGLFDKDKRLYERYLLGNYSKKGDILKRPLAKFTQDIAKQLKLL